MMSKIKCTKCKELREPEKFDNDTSHTNGKQSQCKYCLKNGTKTRKYKDEPFKRNPSPCDSKLADKALTNELKEIWEME